MNNVLLNIIKGMDVAPGERFYCPPVVVAAVIVAAVVESSSLLLPTTVPS